MIDAVIFDMDGLLIDSEPLWDVSMQEVFATLGIDMSSELAAQTRGLRTREVVNYWQNYFKWDSAKSTDDVCEEIINTVTDKIVSEGSAMEGLHYILDFFRAKDLKLGLASSSPKNLIDCVLSHLDIKSYFQQVYSAEFEPYGKPHPAVYLSCAKALKTNPVHCLAFEDSINGMVAAKAARMKVVAVPEAHNQQDKRYALADLKLPSLLHFTEQHFEKLNNW
ncbi:hexitol phosphatase HxpB [Chitinophagaceae bacterium LB-8]|uniref:Hexitol phosphatase HxpB n=1 Tax=Paraflavisolibacter caeni TaxID=2982496 RepID=A0A9X2XP10_9BACT|nr:hexitol phosphatase HxpB [Paraflavisolibacter caeni]MCU7550153.1 hexitol phosphatase HxpB [Paraflavisolibacter caeni]